MFKARLVTFSSLGIALFLLFSTLILVFTMPESMAPDEEMRNDIPEWIALHKALPIGNEAELTYNVWGFSYGFLPYLPSLLALPLIFVLENFLPLHTSVLLASRLISVLGLLLSFIFSLKIANYLFHDKKVNYLFSVSIVLLPQVIFISSYHNNDSFGLMCCLLFLYFLLRGKEDDWSLSSCLGLGVSISMSVLTYYNTLGFILWGAVYCVVVCWKNLTVGNKFDFILKRFLWVLFVVLILSGWFFIRNAILHDGDFLGIDAQRFCAHNKALAGNFVHFPDSPQNSGISLFDMLFEKEWLLTTFKSSVGLFGYMNVPMANSIYLLYAILYFVGIIAGCVYLVKSRHGFELFCMLLCVATVFSLSIYRSYTYDYQAQGRYILPALPVLSILLTFGYQYIQKCLLHVFRYSSDEFVQGLYTYLQKCHLPLAASIMLTILSVYSLLTVMLPNLSKAIVFGG